MTNYEFLRKFQDLEIGISWDKIVDLGFATINYSELDPSSFSNFALVRQLLTDNQISKLEQLFRSLDRNSSIYFENKEELNILAEKFEQLSYKKILHDSWMFYESDLPNLEKFNFIKKVENNDDLETFIDVFDKSYVKNDPQNPYGEVKNFLSPVRNAWKKFGKKNRLEYFIVYKNDISVAVAALNNFEGMGYVSCVGSLPEFRGQGLGKAATLWAVRTSIENGNKIHCLATEEGNYPNEFYKRIGFKTKFTALQMAKQNI